MLTKEQLSPHALELFRRLKESLPPEIASRLHSSRHFVTHSNCATLFLFDVWDRNQTDILPSKHFKYCLGYDRRPGATCDGYFHIWLTRIRIYGEHEDIRKSVLARLGRELPHVMPKEFVDYSHNHDRAFDFKWEFDYPKDLSKLPAMLLPRYVSLISAVHPILMPIIDNFTRPLQPGERRTIVAGRGRIPFTPSGVRDRDRVREYTRSVPPLMRASILKDHSYRCALCGADLHNTGHHIDHIQAWARGGITILKNLQPLCPPCNLKKGKR
jgi:hypothetical protein